LISWLDRIDWFTTESSSSRSIIGHNTFNSGIGFVAAIAIPESERLILWTLHLLEKSTLMNGWQRLTFWVFWGNFRLNVMRNQMLLQIKCYSCKWNNNSKTCWCNCGGFKGNCLWTLFCSPVTVKQRPYSPTFTRFLSPELLCYKLKLHLESLKTIKHFSLR